MASVFFALAVGAVSVAATVGSAVGAYYLPVTGRKGDTVDAFLGRYVGAATGYPLSYPNPENKGTISDKIPDSSTLTDLASHTSSIVGTSVGVPSSAPSKVTEKQSTISVTPLSPETLKPHVSSAGHYASLGLGFGMPTSPSSPVSKTSASSGRPSEKSFLSDLAGMSSGLPVTSMASQSSKDSGSDHVQDTSWMSTVGSTFAKSMFF